MTRRFIPQHPLWVGKDIRLGGQPEPAHIPRLACDNLALLCLFHLSQWSLHGIQLTIQARFCQVWQNEISKPSTIIPSNKFPVIRLLVLTFAAFKSHHLSPLLTLGHSLPTNKTLADVLFSENCRLPRKTPICNRTRRNMGTNP